MVMRILITMLTEWVVYWGTPAPDGRGGHTLATPVEMKARWEDSNETFLDPTGTEQIARHLVYVASDVVVDGWLWQGRLTGLVDGKDVENAPSPGAFRIRQFNKLPTLPGDQYLRTVYI